MTAAPATPLAPTAGGHGSRVVELDALRGLAVIGIVWMNVFVYALPPAAYYSPVAFGGEALADRLFWAASFVLVEDKFRTLFALLFGAGVLILWQRAPGWGAHLARMAVLMAIGLFHAVLLADNDILRAYALAGVVLPLFAGASVRVLALCALTAMVVHLAGSAWIVRDWWPVLSGGGDAETTRTLAATFGGDPEAIRWALERGQESIGERIARRSTGMLGPLTNAAAAVPLNLSSMLAGMALWKAGMLAGEWNARRTLRFALPLALIALPVLMALAGWLWSMDYDPAAIGITALLLSPPVDLALGLAYAGLAMMIFSKKGAITRRFAAAGRLSLTNYLMTSVVLAVIFRSWGFGLFA